MDISKLLTGICVFLLLICIVFCTTALVSLRNAVAESDALQIKAQDLNLQMQKSLEKLERPLQDLSKDPPDTPVDAPLSKEEFFLRGQDGILCVYTAEGELIQTLDVSVQTLPKNERALLQAGIKCDSWQEVMSWIQDLTS